MSNPALYEQDVSWLPDMVLLDLETTGGSHLRDRIIEIALVRIEGGVIAERWETFVNPEVAVPAFITQIPGITNEMVVHAPIFKELAPKLYSYLEGFVMAAHNVRFDHGFLKAEFRRIGAVLRQCVMCTVHLSRRLFPHQQGHSLDAIMQRFGLATNARHRAMGDVQLMLDFLEAARRDVGSVRILEAIDRQISGPSLPPGLDGAFLEKIPDTPGVYIFYGEGALPLYIGKSVTLRTRVLNHFSSDHTSAREMKIALEIKRIEWIETAGELGALILESRLVKERQPVHNRMLRSARKLYSIRLSETLNTTPWVNIVTHDELEPSYFDYVYGMFRSRKKALDTMRELALKHRLCHRILGLEAGKGACFAHQLNRCSGVCASKEKPELHHLRLKQALIAHRLKSWPHRGRIGIKESTGYHTQLHIFNQWCHIGSAEDDIQLDELMQSSAIPDFDMDIYKLLIRAFKKPLDIIQLN